MSDILIVCATIIVCFFGYLWYVKNNPYVDEIIEKTKVVNDAGRWTADQITYKRTYKNGKVKYWHDRV